MLLQGLLKYILYSSRYPSIGFICFPTSGVKGVAALYEAFQVGGGGGYSGEYAVTLLVFSRAACYLEGQKKCCCCILAWTKITLLVQYK